MTCKKGSKVFVARIGWCKRDESQDLPGFRPASVFRNYYRQISRLPASADVLTTHDSALGFIDDQLLSYTLIGYLQSRLDSLSRLYKIIAYILDPSPHQ